MAWLDNAELYRKYGVEKTLPNRVGEYATLGAHRIMEIDIDLAALTSVPTILSDTAIFPKDVRVESVELVTHTAATTSGSGTPGFHLGLRAASRTSHVEIDGFVAAAESSIFSAAGEKTVLTAGSAFAGSLIGVTTTIPGYVSATASTDGRYATGVVKARISYYGVTS